MIWTIVWLSMAIITRITERSSKFEAHYKGHMIEPSFTLKWIDFGHWMATKMNETFEKAQISLFSTNYICSCLYILCSMFVGLINDSRDWFKMKVTSLWFFLLCSPFFILLFDSILFHWEFHFPTFLSERFRFTMSS